MQPTTAKKSVSSPSFSFTHTHMEEIRPFYREEYDGKVYETTHVQRMVFDLRGRLIVAFERGNVVDIWSCPPNSRRLAQQSHANGAVLCLATSPSNPDLFASGSVGRKDIPTVGETILWKWVDAGTIANPDTAVLTRAHSWDMDSRAIDLSSDAVAFVDYVFTTHVYSLTGNLSKLCTIPLLGSRPTGIFLQNLSCKFWTKDRLLLSMGWDLRVAHINPQAQRGLKSVVGALMGVVAQRVDVLKPFAGPHILATVQDTIGGGWFWATSYGAIERYSDDAILMLTRHDAHLPESRIESLQLSKNGLLLVSGGTDQFVRIWRSVTLEPLAKFEHPQPHDLIVNRCIQIAVHPHGEWVVSNTMYGGVRWYDAYDEGTRYLRT